MAPLVEVVKEEPEEQSSESVTEKAQELVAEAVSKKRWKQSPLIGGVAALAILVIWGHLFFGGSGGDPQEAQPGQPYVCDECEAHFSFKGEPGPGAVQCPECRAATGYPATVGVCPHCGKPLELYRTRQTRSTKMPEQQIKAAGGQWVSITSQEALRVQSPAERKCPHCEKLLGEKVEFSHAWK